MSEENVEIVWAFDDAYARGDFEQIAELLHPAIESLSYDGKINRGAQATIEAFRSWLEQWEWYTARIEECMTLNDGRVMVVFRCRGKGKVSGVEVEMQIAEIWTFEGGRVARMWGYKSRAEALEAAGLSE